MSSDTLWIDCEVHILPDFMCRPDFRPADSEDILLPLFWDHPAGPLALPKGDLKGILAEMDRAGIDRAVLLGLPWKDPEMNWVNNDAVAEAVARYPDRFYGFGLLPPPESEDMAAAVRRCQEDYGFIGIKVIPSWQGYSLDDRIFAPALEEAQKRGMILFPHTDYLYKDPVRYDSPHSLFEVITRYPDLRIMAPHLGGLLCLHALYPPFRTIFRNVLFIGSTPGSMEMVSFAHRAIGAEQLAFGTDFPYNPAHDQTAVKQAFLALDIPEDDKIAIAGANAARFISDTLDMQRKR